MPPKRRGAKRPNIFVAASITKKTRTGPSGQNNLLKEREVDVDEQEAQLRKDAEQRSSSSKEDDEEQSDSEEEEEGSKNNEEQQSGSEEDEEESKNDEEEKSNSEKDGEGSKNDEEEQREAKENEEEPSREEADESQASKERRSKFLNDMDVQPATVEESTSVSDLDDLSIPEVIKSINIEKYGFIMPVDMHENHEGSIVNRSMLGKGFSEFREILVKQKIYDDFKNSCFGHFLDLPESVICRFQMNLVHGLMFRRILSKKTKELWFIYNDMPVCFGLNEFALISGLKCHPLPPDEDLEKAKADGEFLCDIVGKSATGAVLLKKIQTKKLDKKVKVALSLLWFLHSVICAKDLNKVIEYDWLKLAFTPEVFNNYPWGRISYNITVGSLIQEVKPKKIANLFGFPWAFMAWAFEAIPPVRKIFKNPPSEMSLPRITRWLSVKSKNANFDPFQSSENMMVHPFLVPTNRENGMDYMLNIEPFPNEPDVAIDALKSDLDGVTTIVVEAVGGSGAGRSGGGNAERIDVGGTEKLNVGGGERIDGVGGNTSSRPGSPCMDFDFGGTAGRAGEYTYGELIGRGGFSGGGDGERSIRPKVLCCCECPKCIENNNALKKVAENLHNVSVRLEDAAKRIEEEITKLKEKRGVRPSVRITSPFTPELKRKQARIRKAMAAVGKDKSAQVKREWVDIFRPVDIEKKEALENFMSIPFEERILYTTHEFNFKDFNDMINMKELWDDRYVDEILCLMRIRHKKYPRHYDPKDIILDLNFYNYLKVAYKKIKDDSSVEGAIPMTERLAKFEFNNDILNYVKGARPFPGGRKWDEAKRIFTVMTIGVRHYVALEFVIEEGKILVFDCNIPATEEAIFFTHIQPVLELWPKLLKQSGRFKHLSEKLLNEDWPYERLQTLPHNETGTACGPYAISFIEHLITYTSMEDLNDNAIEDFRLKSVVAVYDKNLVP